MLDAETAVMVHNIYMRGIYNSVFSIALAMWVLITFYTVERVLVLWKLYTAIRDHKQVVDLIQRLGSDIR